ncbi:MAG: NAD(P)-dependent oxidoreductase, partial [Pseudomonadota bacterium]
MPARAAFIGLGVMGFPMAGHLQSAGHPVTVYNRTRDVARRWVEVNGGAEAATPAEAAAGADVVLVCVGNDSDVRDVVLGDSGALAGMREGAVLVDHTTASAALARELEERCRERGCGFLDAPVSGGQAGAEGGTLTVMVGGEQAVFEQVESVIDSYARYVRLLGPAGNGQLAKMVNQICIAGVVQGLAEALHFAEQAGLDAPAVVDTISRGAAQSWQMDNRALTMLEGRYDFGFAVDWMRKDLGLALDEARRNGSTLPLAALVDQYYADV